MYPPVPLPHSHITSLTQYQQFYSQSIKDLSFWETVAKEYISWITPFKTIFTGSLKHGNIAWFSDGELNVSYNCVDRHAQTHPNKIALIWEGDEPGNNRYLNYEELLRDICQCANALKSLGIKKGDSVAIYLPMVPEAVIAMLACARIGAVHSVVFAGFSADALKSRIQDASSKVLITADQGLRGGKTIHLKKIADEALMDCPTVQNVLVFQRTGDSTVPFHPTRDVWWHDALKKERPFCCPEKMNAEDPLFMLYTSGSTGKPKGLVHTQAGYLLGTMLSFKYIFDWKEGDVHGCMADIGWITGHSYIVYGPLAMGATTVLFESVPTYPTASRYWEVVEKHQINTFYTAPTAIRALRRLGDQFVEPFTMNSLRVIGTVGEPINPEAWTWYYNLVGKQRCPIVDTYWQTETGSFLLCPFPGATPTKPGSATFPFFGIDPVILEPTTGKVLEGPNVTGVLVLSKPFPSLARTVYKDHQRYLDTYMNPYPGYFFTGDEVHRDKDNYLWILGRMDDVINVAGHRLSTSEIESALILNPHCAEAAAIGIPDDITGQAVACFCTIKGNITDEKSQIQALIQQVRSHIGPFAAPKHIILVSDLPKTRSGKIMRRILRKIASKDITLDLLKKEGDQIIQKILGDVSTLADSNVIGHLLEKVQVSLQ